MKIIQILSINKTLMIVLVYGNNKINKHKHFKSKKKHYLNFYVMKLMKHLNKLYKLN